MTATGDIAACNWQDIGGAQAALTIRAFLQGIDIAVTVAPIATRTLLTGMTVSSGGILIDPEKRCWAGDLLHEAGHIAVTAPENRATLSEISNDGGEEMAAIAWSVAAAKACDISLETLFHSAGYRGGGQSLIEAFKRPNPLGVPLLAWYGMTEQSLFPEMKRWLR